MPRIPSVKSCIKRLSAITITELRLLSTRDLKGILMLEQPMQLIKGELEYRKQKVHPETSHVSEHATA